jgi:predicted pyridoxine 5'-phosphate oxidase superfamily flavin-nucleotide-binding protein
MSTGWNMETSPFHPGEQELQNRLGIREDMEAFGRRVIRNHLTEQHQTFFASLGYLYIGSVDDHGRPWASMVSGAPGFIKAPDDRQLRIDAKLTIGDPLANNLVEHRPLGILGLDLSNRRRNRVNGRVRKTDSDSLSIDVEQAFGNCPRYIRKRKIHTGSVSPPRSPVVTRGHLLDDNLNQLVTNAETFFIATVSPGDRVRDGADISHRGGKPGFVRVEGGRTLVFPDFSGNGHFNTLGNLLLNDRAGLLFVDFDNGDVLQLTGRAIASWESNELSAFKGAEQLVRFELSSFVYIANALNLRFSNEDTSPFLEATGHWPAASSPENSVAPQFASDSAQCSADQTATPAESDAQSSVQHRA